MKISTHLIVIQSLSYSSQSSMANQIQFELLVLTLSQVNLKLSHARSHLPLVIMI